MSKFDYLAYAEMERQEVEPRQELEQKELHLNKGENTDQKTVVPFCMSEEIKNSEILQTEERSVDTKESSVPSDWLKQETDDEMVGVEEKGFIPSPSLNAIDLHRYSYTYRSAQDSSQRDRKMLSKTTLDKVRDFLSKEHRKLFQESIIDRLKRKALSAIVSEYISSQNIVETGYTADELIKTVVDSLAGLDVLEDLLENEAITDINVNGKNEIWIEE
ncbi:MAG TPA: hypothetical protein VNM69_03770, partial [Bacillus sp. (in: firmicutes)]|nr:hypothetical protein [Bacillus sp. (in: firmicutes)]